MNFMKVAIAGKDDEQFPGGDEPGGAAMEATAKPPAILKPSSSAPGAKSAMKLSAPQPGFGTHIKPALPAKPALVRPKGTVKPALNVGH
jgi:hypothetical protein